MLTVSTRNSKTIYGLSSFDFGRERMNALKAALSEKDISVILPAYNEAARIEKCVKEVERAVGSFSGSYEIIVAEDGSTDGTTAFWQTFQKAIPT